ncbi:pentatricopeptide repeat-containing protein At3g29230-like [Magnolia sinica]|uniref:pentatricopeptide repeat-containing protein At3g29230-like n=1 Tax=Magnolia sinica TaxID=86752 RepID=UPI002658F9A2|nr:pentatricopeptide repeat-containing protein At3g29230-like [Magnolia sinica]
MEQKMLQILQNCKNIREFKQTHVQIFVHGLQNDKFLIRKLIDLSSTFHSLDYAIRIFEDAQSPNVFIYNTLIKCFNERNRKKDAFLTFNQMKESEISPNNFTFTFLLKSCELSEALVEGMEFHAQIIKSGYGLNVFVQNTLLDFYSKCNQELDLACQVFDEMPVKDVVSWNSMINAYMNKGDMASAIGLFETMPERNVVSWNSVIAGLSKVGDMKSAQSVFERMPMRNTVSWNAMITGYARRGELVTARSIFNWMPDKDVVSWTAMISGYTQTGNLASASELFDQMPIKNLVSWNTMIAGYVHNHLFYRALHTFHQMLTATELKPDEATLTSVLSACAHLGALEHGTWVDSYIKKNKFKLTVTLGNALIDMFAKCGDMKNANTLFNQMTKRCIITWTTMVSGLALNGQCKEALAIFDAMCRERVAPDDVIFIAVLTACTHGGLVEEGQRIFNRMVGEFGIEPRIEHYGCMVDLLGRAGKLQEALGFIMNMPIEPNAVIWATLLGSCQFYGDGKLAEFVARKIIDLEPLNPGYRVLISNLNASIGRWEDVLNARAAMREEGMEKVPGCSSIQVGNGVHEFLARDTRHEHSKEIYEALDGLTEQLKAVGYVPCRSHNVALHQEQ